MSVMPMPPAMPTHFVEEALTKVTAAQGAVSATGKLKWSGDAAAQYAAQRPGAVRSVAHLHSCLLELELAIMTFNLLRAAMTVAQASGVPLPTPPSAPNTSPFPALPTFGGRP